MRTTPKHDLAYYEDGPNGPIAVRTRRSGQKIKHGRAATYRRYGCSCDPCREDHNRKQRKWRRTERKRKIAL